MAKDILSKYVTLNFDDSGATARDLTGDLLPDTLAGVGLDYEEVDMTGQSDDLKAAMGGQGDGTITAQFHMNDTATTGAFTVLNGMINSSGTLTIAYGTGAVPTTGDPEWEGEYTLFSAPVSLTGGRAVISATWKPSPGASPAWGTVS